MVVLDNEHKLIVASMQEDDLIDLHFSLVLRLGMYLNYMTELAIY